MKSIALCENTHIKQDGDTKDLKETVTDEQLEEKVKLNGAVDDKKSESEVSECNSEKRKNFLHNWNNGTKEAPSVAEVSENGENRTAEISGSSERETCAPSDDEKSTTVTMETNTSSNDKSENCIKGTKNSLDVSENPDENSNAPSSSKQGLESEKPVLCVNVDSFDEVCNELSEISIFGDGDQTTEQVAINSTSKDEDNDFLSDDSSKMKVKGSEQPLKYEIFDVDSNKENVKDEKANSVEDLPKDGEEDEGSSCEIQVEKVQTVSSQDSDFIWLPSDSEKSQKDGEESSQEVKVEESDVSICNEGLQKSSEEEKEKDCQALVVIDNVSSEHLENDELQMEVEEADQGVDVNEEENKIEHTEWDESCGETESKKTDDEEDSQSRISKKRPITDDKDDEPSAKKIKLSENEGHEDSVDELKSGSTAFVDSEGHSSKVGGTSFEGTAEEEKGTDKRPENSEKLEKEGESEKESAAPTSSFLASFRGSLKNLTRSDLEELIVQKLCEVITERSTVGELRRKAQALEQDQERWKLKVQTLSKQMKEMEMVMKKYTSEVQKQLKDGATHVVTPLRVTRSVGLQVSFYTYPNRGSKPNASPPATPCPAQTVNTRSSKGSPKPPPQYTPVRQTLRSKSMPACPKTSPSPQKTPVTQQRRLSTAPSSAPANRTITTGTVPIISRPVPPQVSGPRPVYKPVIGAVQQQQQQHQQLQQSQQLQQQQQHGSKVIDLTEDDDQRTNSTGKSNTPTRVISHLPQPAAPPGGRYAYLVPATSTSTGLGGTQNRQVLIATPAIQTPQQNRQIMCSMPPLLFKGGNQIQPASQPQAITQNNRVILPKVIRHPAPLPQAPIRNWANMKQLPPRPALKISKVQTGIVLSWNMVLGPEHAPIRSYQLYAYQESNSPPATSLWKKVGDVKALPLPMACTLTQFMSGHKYHFAVRAVDLHSRIGPFSFPGTIVLDKGR